MRQSPIVDEQFADLLLHARGLQVVRNLLAARGASDAELDEHTRALERVRHQLAEKLVA